MPQNDFSATVILDSVNGCPGRGERLTTLELTFPRFILPEFNTHRVFSRNSASSRAIPVVKQLKKVLESPFIPDEFGSNKPGMQASENLKGSKYDEARDVWLSGRDNAVYSALPLLLGRAETAKVIKEADGLRDPKVVKKVLEAVKLYEDTVKEASSTGSEHPYLNVHKQLANRLLEPFTWHTVVVTSTEWSNFWALRDNDEAQPEIHKIAHLAHKAYLDSSPNSLKEGEWHLPFVREDEIKHAKNYPEIWKKVSAGRCARVSYETHAGIRDHKADIVLFERLVNSGHMSPLEHIAEPMSASNAGWSGNFKGWRQWRKEFTFEDDFAKVLNQNK